MFHTLSTSVEIETRRVIEIHSFFSQAKLKLKFTIWVDNQKTVSHQSLGLFVVVVFLKNLTHIFIWEDYLSA